MDESKAKFLTDEFVLSGTLNVRSFVSPIKGQTFNEKHLTKSVARSCVSKAGILCTSSPTFEKNRAASTPAYEHKKNFDISFGLSSNKENDIELNKKRKFDFLKEINEVDETLKIGTQAIAEAAAETFNPVAASSQIVEPVVVSALVNNVPASALPKESELAEPIVNTSAIVVSKSVEAKIGYERIDLEIKEEEIESVSNQHCAEDILKLSQIVTKRFNLENLIVQKGKAK